MVDPRGKIKSGMKAKNSQGVEYPKSLDYFNIDKFDELKAAYGEKPAALVVKFPSDELIDFFDCNFELYGGRKGEGEAGTLIRRCDGETCIHRIKESVDDHKGSVKIYAAGEETPCICQDIDEKDKQRCRYSAYLKAWIVLPQTGNIENPLCYLFETHSQNSGDAIMSAINDVRILTGGTIRGVTFSLAVKMVSGKTDAKQKFPIWTLLPIGTVSGMREAAGRLVAGAPTIAEHVLLPLLGKGPGAVEDPILKESRMLFERYFPQIKSISTVVSLNRLKEEINAHVREARITQADYDRLLEAMKARAEELRK
jgi:hypothetical protein